MRRVPKPLFQIALFFTGRQHAGENLGDVLKHRARDLERPIQMSDALSRNAPKNVDLLVANCLAHGRRRFIEMYLAQDLRTVGR